MKPWPNLLTVLLFFVGGGIYIFNYSPPGTSPNVIIISVDSLRADHMALYGYTRETMPAVEAWSKGGFVFDDYFATSYLTPISEGSIQTGDYPFDDGIINFTATPRGTVATLGEILKQAGYATAAFGSSPEYKINRALTDGFSRGFDTFIPYATTSSASLPGQSVISGRTSGAFIDDALAWLANTRDKSKPFYLWLPLGTAHMPYFQGKPIHFTDSAYKGSLSKISYDEFETLYGFLYGATLYDPNQHVHSPVTGTLTLADKKYIVDRYDDGIYLADELLARLFNYLKQSGLDANTVVVFESEHGETLGERGYISHYDIYDETTHVPLIIKVPGIEGTRIKGLISGVDILPTVLALLHVPHSARVDGINYVPYLMNPSALSPRSNVFITRTPLWERVTEREPIFAKLDNTAHYHDTAIRSVTWELIHRSARFAEKQYGWWGLLTGYATLLPEYQLYDVMHDPGEKTDVYAAHANDPSVLSLKTKLDAFDTSIIKNLPGPSTDQLQPYF